MSFEKLNSSELHAAILSGCQHLIQQKQLINSINVFPVADGDTGDNLSSTCQAIIDYSSAKPNLLDTLLTVADASIIGARGNSGIIFSQFFNLLTKYIPRIEWLEFQSFSYALTQVGGDISGILSKPVDGTIITIIQKFAQHAKTKIMHPSFSEAMSALLPSLFLDVEKTRKTLDVLKEANVVDAGALGFYYFIEGFTKFLQNAFFTSTKANQAHLTLDHYEIVATHPPDFRYCTEAVLKGSSLNKDELMSFLNQQGDCASIAGNDRTSRVHVHTNDPQALFTTLYKKYLIQYPKVDDMLRQYHMQFEPKQRIALVTDSSADLPQDILDAYQIHQFCLNIHIDEHHFLDKYCFAPDYFYQELREFKTYPKTSCLNASIIEERLGKIAKHYENVIVLSISSKMSGTYEAFIKAAEKYKNIRVIDTKTNSGAHGLLLDYAGRLITADLPFEDILAKLNHAIQHSAIYVIVNQFDSMIRSGRIHKLSGKIANLANIKPIVSIDKEGHGTIAATCFSFKSAQKKLLRLLDEKLHNPRYTLLNYCIVHADALDQAKILADKSQEAFHKAPLFIEPVSISIGLHAGNGCVALAALILDNKTGTLLI